MAPGGGGKRKRPERTFSHDSGNDGQRPSPHRPGNLALGQQNNHQQHGQSHYGHGRDQHDQRGRSGRRGSRGGRGNIPRSPLEGPNSRQNKGRPGTAQPSPMSPPQIIAQPSKETTLPSPSRASSPVNNVSTQTASAAPVPIAPYHYDYLKDDIVVAWQEKGKAIVIDQGLQACREENAVALCLLFQEIVRSGLDGRLDPPEAGTIVKAILEGGGADHESQSRDPERMPIVPSFDARSLFLDGLSTLTESDALHVSLRPLVFSTGIPPLLMRRELESNLLEQLFLIRNTFVRVGIRQQTNLLYRQSNYNLLREETEGYSKLLTELFTTSNNEPPISEVVEDTFERVKGMIGAFDLDVGRVLDVTLDVFAAVLVKQYRFFVKFLRASSWWPQGNPFATVTESSPLCGLPSWALPGTDGLTRIFGKDQFILTKNERDSEFWERARQIGIGAFFELGGRKKASITESTTGSLEVDEDRKWFEETGTMPPTGNKVAAQILGFKLRFYSSSARDPHDVLPVNLVYLAALLIKIGFISLRDLYPHIWPEDKEMENVRADKTKEKSEREKLNRPGGGSKNALMTAGALADDTMPAPGRLRETDGNRGVAPKPDLTAEKPAPTTATATATAAAVEAPEEPLRLPEPSDQKVQLLKSLLCIGALPESLFILGRFPWLMDLYPELPEHLHRILHHCLSKLYEPLRPLQHDDELRWPASVPDPDQIGVPKGQVRRVNSPSRKILRWAQLDKEDINEGTDYRFYWDEWADTIPICQSVDDIFSLCGTLMNYTGVKIGQDPALLIKLARIGNHSLTTDSSESNLTRWIDLSKRLLVPSLSLTKCNPGVVNEVFGLIRRFSTATRYSIYAEWYSGSISRLPDIKSAFDQAKAETKDVLKRISKTNIKPMARALAKVAYASPGIVFTVAIGQIESYDNLVEVVVECARYFTYLGYDVLTWSLMSALGARGRNRVQADGMLTSKWLSALSLFAGKVFKRYSTMSPTPILQYVTDQLRKSNSTDLIVLEEIIGSMAGIVSDASFNDVQTISMAGGATLQSQTMLQLLDRRHESKSTAKRLMRSLVEPKLAGQLLIAIAQERQTSIFKISEPDAHLKLLGNLFDEIHRVLTQYLDLLRSNLSIKEFDSLVPQVSALIGEYGIEPSVAFWISRPSIEAAMTAYDVKLAEQKRMESDTGNGDASDDTDHADVEMSEPQSVLDEKVEANGVSNDETTSVKATLGISVDSEEPQDGMDITQVEPTTKQPSDSENDAADKQPWHPVLAELMDAIGPCLPSQTWDMLGKSFYVTFWQLSLYHVLVPTSSYDDEINRQKKKATTIGKDRSDLSVVGIQKKEREVKALNELQNRLRAEFKDHIHAHQLVRARLQREKDHWFVGLWGKWDALNIALIEHCFFPRILISPSDALYTFRILKFLHSSGTANFRTMGVLDQMFNDKRLTSMVFLCTAKEIESFGPFLNEILKDLSRWHASKAVFEKEAYGKDKNLPGFSKKMESETKPYSFWTYEEFRRVLLKWHRNLNMALKVSLTSGEYMHIRNAIIVLKSVHLYFPAINWMGQSQVSTINDLIKTETREDLKIAATSLLGSLRRREKEWMLPQAFNLIEATTNRARSASAKPGTPQPAGEAKNDAVKRLNAKAPEFSPGDRMHVNGTGLSKPEVEDGEEDGEIEDVKISTLASNAGPVTNSTDVPLSLVQQAQVRPATDEQEESTAAGSYATAKLSEVQPANETKGSTGLSGAQDANDSKQSGVDEVIPTASANTASLPVRPDLEKRNQDVANKSPLQHALPTRPDLPPPSRISQHRMPEKPSDRSLRDPLRDSRYLEESRHGRSIESSRERMSDRHVSSPHLREHDRASDRMPLNERLRSDPNWGGERLPASQPHLDDRNTESPGHDSQYLKRDDRSERGHADSPYHESSQISRNETRGLAPRDRPMAPPRSNVPQHPDRAALIHASPEVDRLHSNAHNDRRPESSHRDGHPSSQRSSRATSPARRDDHRSSRHESRRDDPPEIRRHGEEGTYAHPSRVEDARPPTGPRSDRSLDIASSASNDRFRDNLRSGPSATVHNDPNHGRLKQDPGATNRSQESQYGRLNASPDIPSGPRLQNGILPPSRGGRNSTGSQPSINTHHAQPPSNPPLPSPTMPERPAPTGPASGRAPQRSTAPFSRPPVTSSAPPTPTTDTPDVSGVHPDRLKAIQSPGIVPAANQMLSNRSSLPSPTSTQPPLAPRASNNAQPPSPQNNQNQNPPLGPSFSNDRSRSDKRFAGIQNVLQQGGTGGANNNAPDRSSGQGASIRGRGARGSGAVPLSSLAGPTPAPLPAPSAPTTRHDNFPPPMSAVSASTATPGAPGRPDLFAVRGGSRQNMPSGQQHGQGQGPGQKYDDSAGRGARDNNRRDTEPRRSTRHGGGTGRSSRSQSRDRDRDRYDKGPMLGPGPGPGSGSGSGGLPPPMRGGPPMHNDGRERARDEYSRGGPNARTVGGGGGLPGPGSGPGSGPVEHMERDRRAESDRRSIDMRGGESGGGGGGRGGRSHSMRGDERDRDRERERERDGRDNRRDGGGRKRGRGGDDYGPPSSSGGMDRGLGGGGEGKRLRRNG